MITREILVAKRDELKQKVDAALSVYRALQKQAQELNEQLAQTLDTIKIVDGQRQMLDSLIGPQEQAAHEKTVRATTHPIKPNPPKVQEESAPTPPPQVTVAKANPVVEEMPAKPSPQKKYDAASAEEFMKHANEDVDLDVEPVPPTQVGSVAGMRGSVLEISQES